MESDSRKEESRQASMKQALVRVRYPVGGVRLVMVLGAAEETKIQGSVSQCSYLHVKVADQVIVSNTL